MVGGGVGDGVPAEDEKVGVAARLGDPGLAFPVTGLVGNGKARAGLGAWGRGAVVGVPALAGGGLLDLDPQRTFHRLQVGHLPQIARPPIVRAQHPVRLQRLRHHLLDQLATNRVAEERGAEQAVGQAGDEGGGHLASAARRRMTVKRNEICIVSPEFGVPGIAGIVKRANKRCVPRCPVAIILDFTSDVILCPLKEKSKERIRNMKLLLLIVPI